MSDQLAPEHFTDWNEQMLQRYDPAVFARHPRGVVRWVESRRTQAVIRRLDARPEHRVLDVGCGTGHILALLPCKERHGVDLSSRMVQHAQGQLGNAAKIIQGDAERLPYEDASFDRVVASSLFSHVLHPETVVAEIKRVTRPGGRVVVSVCHEDKIERGMRWMKAVGLGRLIFGKGGPQVYNVEYHLHRFSLERLRDVVAGGLIEQHVTGIPCVFPVHAVVVYERPQ